MGAYILAHVSRSSMIYRISDSSFAREVLVSAAPVLVTFIGDDCGPCRAIVQILEQLTTELEGNVKLATIDVGHNQESRARYDIHGLPTMIVFIGGEIVARRVGAAIEKDSLKAWLDASVSSVYRS